MILKIEDLVSSYGVIKALKGVSLEVREGELVRKCALLKKERIHISSNTTTILLNKLSFCIPAYIELLRSTNRIQIIFSAIFKFPDQYL